MVLGVSWSCCTARAARMTRSVASFGGWSTLGGVAGRERRARRDAMERTPPPSRVRGRRSGGFSGSFFFGLDDTDEEYEEPSESVTRLWFERPDRYREEQGEGDEMQLIVRDGGRGW